MGDLRTKVVRILGKCINVFLKHMLGVRRQTSHMGVYGNPAVFAVRVKMKQNIKISVKHLISPDSLNKLRTVKFLSNKSPLNIIESFHCIM